MDFDPKHSFPVSAAMLGIVSGTSRGGGASSLDLQKAHDTLQRQHQVQQRKLASLKQEVKTLRGIVAGLSVRRDRNRT